MDRALTFAPLVQPPSTAASSSVISARRVFEAAAKVSILKGWLSLAPNCVYTTLSEVHHSLYI